MRKISLERIGEYIKTALEILHDHGNEYPSRLLILDMQKKLKPNEYEKSKSKTGAIRWKTKFRFWTVGLVKAGLIKKEKKRWYLTNEGLKIINKSPLELVKISRDGYKKWFEQNKTGRLIEEKPLSIEEALRDISPTPIPAAANMVIKPDSITFNDILRGVDKSLIQIPPFQRDFVWSARAIVYLLDSIYKGYPIGSFIFWKTKKQLPRHREIGGIKLNDITPGTLIDYVIDGQQRITSIYAAVKGARIEQDRYKFYFDISTGKFDYEKMRDNEEENRQTRIQDYTQVPLEKIFVEPTEYFRYIRQFPEEHSNVLNDLFNRFKDYPFPVIYIQNIDEDSDLNDSREDIKKIVKIFTRINDTGRKLTVVAKMVARCWEENFELRDYLNELLQESDELSEIREETILQISSVILNNKKCRSRNILEDTNIDELKKEWDKIIDAFKLTLSFLRDKLRIRNFKYLPFDSILVPLTYFHYKNHNPSNSQTEQLFRWFWKASLSNRFSSTVEAKIEMDCNDFDKILDGKDVEFSYPIDWEILKLRLINQNYNFRNAFCKTVLSLYSYMQPKHFKDNRDIDLVGSFSGYSKHNLHHFFPRGYLNRIDHPKKELKDSIVNIAFSPAILNIEISDRAPSDYIKEFSDLNVEISDTLKSHLISDVKKFGIISDNFDIFLEKRAEKIENELRILLGLTTKTEQQFEEKPATPVDLFEIKMRNLLNVYLIKEYGENYWEEAIPQDIRDVVDRKIKDDLRIHPYNEPKYINCETRIKFLDIMDYFKIIMANWILFKDIFASRAELEKHFTAIKNYRNAIKHGRELDIVDQKNGEAAILWFEKALILIDNS